MGWEDPDSIWAKKMRLALTQRRRAARWQAIAGCFVVLAMSLQWVPNLLDPKGWDWVLGPAMVGLGILALVFGAINVWSVFFRRRSDEPDLVALVPEADGQVCAVCECGLDEQANCPKCHREFDEDKVREYWELFALEPHSAAELRAELLATTKIDGKMPKRRAWITTPRGQMIYGIGVLLFVLMVIPIAMGLMLGGSFVINAIRVLPFTLSLGLIMGGALLGATGRGLRRTGRTRHCPECGYQQSPTRGDSACCPECATAWSGAGGAVTGKRERHPERIAIGIGVAAAGFVWLMWQISSVFAGGSLFGPGRLAGALPTSSLVAQVTEWPSTSDDEWLALSKRELSDEQRLALAEGLLDHRLRDPCGCCGQLGGMAETWFVGALNAGELPDELVERYYAEMMDVSLEAPGQPVTVGEPFDVSLPIVNRMNPASIDAVADGGAYYFAGLAVLNRDDRPASDVDIATNRPIAPLNPRAGPFVTTITATAPGTLHVQAVLWKVVGPTAVVRLPASWNDDGTPVIPTGVTWWKRVVLTGTIEIVPE